MAVGIGCTIGPAISTLLYRWFNYIYTMYTFSAIIFVVGMISIYALPCVDKEETAEEADEKKIEISYSDFFKRSKVIMAIIT